MEFLAVIIWCACAFIAHQIAKPKGYPYAGIVLGFFLGIIGILIVLWLPKKAGPSEGSQPPTQPFYYKGELS